ncbi:efflux RND transporter permease subunit [Candidatus Neomarinimicrobiota bacterium]
MKSFIRFFASNHLLANLLTVAILLAGLNSLRTIKRDLYPNVDMGMMVVTTRYPGASPEDVEINVTTKLEDQLKGVDGLHRMTSYSLENISVVNLEIDPDAKDAEEVKRDIREAIGNVGAFPREVTDNPSIFDVKTENFEVIRVGISGQIPYVLLRRLAKYFEKGLLDIEGVSRVERTGFLAREVKIEVTEEAITEYQLPLQEIVGAIQMRNIRASGGSFESYTNAQNIVTLAQFRDTREVEDVIVRSAFGGPRVRIKDLAVVESGFEPEKTRFRMNGHAVIGFTIFKKGSADIIRVIEGVKEYVDEQRKLMPPDVEVMYSADQSRFVRNQLGGLATNGLIGLALVTGVLFIFLNFRTAFWVAMGIPLTLAGVVFIGPYIDIHIDMLTLMAMILVIGLIVDDAIVIGENIYHRMEKGIPPLEAAVEGTARVIRPVFATILTTILAFSPFLFMTGMLGKFMYAIPLTIIIALAISLVEAILILPAHISGGRRLRPADGAEVEVVPIPKSDWFERLRDRFQRIVVIVLAWRYVVVMVFLVMMVGAFAYASKYMQFVLFPGDTDDEFIVVVELPTGASLDATTDKVKEIEALLDALPEDELDSYWSLVGSQGGGYVGMSPGESENWALGYITLVPFSQRDRTAETIIEELRAAADSIGGLAEIRFQLVGGPPAGRPIEIRLVGTDDNLRMALADTIVANLAAMDGVTDIGRDDKLGKRQLELKLDHDRLSELGLTVADVAQSVRLAYDGQLVTSVRYGDEDVAYRVIMEESARRSPETLGDLQIPNRQGRLIALKEIATFKEGPGPSNFYHWEGERAITITAALASDSKLTPLEITNQMRAGLDLPTYWPGIRLIVGGEAEETAKSMVSLGSAMLTAAIGIYLVLVLLFNSITQPLIVMFAIPFGMIGVIGAFALHGQPLGFMAVLGVIGMMGVVVNDSLILVSFINIHRAESPEKKYLRIVAEGTSSRLRPIILTSITTVAGLIPTAYGFGGFDPFIAPMALALGYGILFATPLTLLLLPALYMVQHDVGKLIRRIPRFRKFYFIPQKLRK